MNKKIRLHPFDIVSGMKKYLIILAVPLFRGLSSVGEGGGQWQKGAWIDLAALIIIIALGALRWKRSYITVVENAVRYTRGLFFRYTDIYIIKYIQTVELRRPFYMRPFHASVLKLSSLGKTRREFRPLILSMENAVKICDFLAGCGEGEIKIRPDYADVAFTSAASSTITGGLAFLFALITNIGRIIGKSLAGEVYGVYSDIAAFFAFGLPPALLMIPTGIAVLYIFAFLQKLSTYFRVTITRGEKTLGVSGGMFRRYKYSLLTNEISSVDFRYRLILRFFRRCSVLIGISGYGGGGFLPVLVPSSPLFEAARLQKRLLPEFSGFYCPIRPRAKGFRLNHALPFAVIAFLCAAAAGAGGFFLREYQTFITVWGLVLTAWFIWVSANKACAATHTGLGFHAGHICAMYERKRVFHRVILPKERIIGVNIKQDPLQRKHGTCRVAIYERGVRAKKHVVRSMPYKKVKESLAGCCGFGQSGRERV